MKVRIVEAHGGYRRESVQVAERKSRRRDACERRPMTSTRRRAICPKLSGSSVYERVMAEQCGSQHRRTAYVTVGIRALAAVCRLENQEASGPCVGLFMKMVLVADGRVSPGKPRVVCGSAHGSRQQCTTQRPVSPMGRQSRLWRRRSSLGERVTTRGTMASRMELQVPAEHDVKIRGRLLGIILTACLCLREFVACIH